RKRANSVANAFLFISGEPAMTLPVRALLDTELNDLNQAVLALSSMVDSAIGQAVDALMANDVPLAESIIIGDTDINRLRFQIEEKAYVILSTQQPLARDLRTVIAAIHFAIELERIGDHAAGIARIVTRMENMPRPALVEEPAVPESSPLTPEDDQIDMQFSDAPTLRLKLSRLPKMTKRARDMLHRATEAY